jgi:hypothetical protein
LNNQYIEQLYVGFLNLLVKGSDEYKDNEKKYNGTKTQNEEHKNQISQEIGIWEMSKSILERDI